MSFEVKNVISVNFSKPTLFMAQKLTFRRQSISSAKNASHKTLENNRFVNLLPIHKRAAAERRIKGVRPAIAAVIHQKSDIIMAALQTTSDCKQHKMEDLTEKYRQEHNMYTLNTRRVASKDKDRKSVMNTNAKYRAKIAWSYNKTYMRSEEADVESRKSHAKIVNFFEVNRMNNVKKRFLVKK